MYKRFFIKLCLLILPLALVSVFFIVDDPMRIIKSYEDPLQAGVLMNDRLFQYKYLSKHDNEYNAFIFGSSRSKSFKTSDWCNQLELEVNPFHMGVNDETIYGIAYKLEFLYTEGYAIDYALLVIDHRILSLTKDHIAHTFMEHPAVVNKSTAEYYKNYIFAFLRPAFIKAYFNYRTKGIVDPDYLWDPGFTYNALTGDHFYTRYDSILAVDSNYYYENYKKDVFYKRSPEKLAVLINADCESFLNKIKNCFVDNKTKYKIVITPNYDQKTLNQADIDKLYEIFGDENIFDYSGVNSITNEVGNYYEHKHFKPYIANNILIEIY